MKDTQKAKARCLRYRAKKHEKKFGKGAGDMRGKHSNHARGSKHHRWNQQRIISEQGYVKIRVGIGHPLADPNGYAYEHLIVWAAAGMPLPDADELIHHIDSDRTNNRIDNLQKMTRSEHGKHHIAERKRDTAGRLLDGREHNEMPARPL